MCGGIFFVKLSDFIAGNYRKNNNFAAVIA